MNRSRVALLQRFVNWFANWNAPPASPTTERCQTKDDNKTGTVANTDGTSGHEIHSAKIFLEKGEWKYMEKHGQTLFSTTQGIDRLGVRLDYKKENEKYILVLTGPGQTPRDVKSNIEADVLPLIKYGKHQVTYAGLSAKNFREGTKGKKYLEDIENNIKCAIEARSGDFKSQFVHTRSSSHYVRSIGTDSDWQKSRESTQPKFLRKYNTSEGDDGDDCAGALKPSTPSNVEILCVKCYEAQEVHVMVVTAGNKNADLSKGGAVAKTVVASGGPELQKSYASRGPADFGKLVCIPASGNLVCQYVFVIGVKKWNDAQWFRVEMEKTFNECISQASKYGVRSIMFPAIGQGSLGFPAYFVVHAIARSAARAPKLQVKLACPDENMRSDFQRSLDNMPHQGCIPKHIRPNQESTKHHFQPIAFHINALSEDVIETVKTRLDDALQNLHTKTVIKKSYLSELNKSQCKKLCQLCDTSVHLKLDKRNKQIVLSGEKESVGKAQLKIENFLDNIKSKLAIHPKSYNRMKRDFGREEFLRKIANDDLQVPQYWKHYKGEKIVDVLAEGGGKEFFRVDVSDKTRKAVSKIVYSTWESTNVGLGADAAGLRHRYIKIISAQRIESAKLFLPYKEQRAAVCRFRMKNNIKPVKGLMGEKEVKTSGFRLNRALIPEINEHYLFHGTNSEQIDPILSQGLDNRLTGYALFGKGTYFSESSTKADQYADDRNNRSLPGTELFMLLCRVTLGNVFVSKKPCSNRNRPPCMGRNCFKENCKKHTTLHDSVLGTHTKSARRLLFREFVVYEQNKCYPEYLIKYVRK